MKNRKIFIAFIFTISLLSSGIIAFANNESPKGGLGGYSIEGLPNSHQIDKNAGYFHLYEKPSEEDQIKVKLINDSEEDKHLLIKVVDGNTNINGDIDYTGTLKNHPELTQPLTSILKVERPEVTVPKHSAVESTLKLKMPARSFTGIILGGIVVSEVQNNTSHSSILTNTYSYTLGCVLTNVKTNEMKKNISVSLDKVGAKLFDGKKVVEADILNDNPFIFSKGRVSGTIKEKNSGKVIKKVSKDDVSIAPYSAFPLQFDWKKSDLESGKYIFNGTVKDDKQSWKFEREFIIAADQAKRINKKSAIHVFIPLWLKVMVGVSCALAILMNTIISVRIHKLRKRVDNV